MGIADSTDIIMESIKIALEKGEGRHLDVAGITRLVESLRDEFMLLREVGATVEFNSEETATALAELCMMWIMPIDEDFDPHLILRRIPDEVLEQILANAPKSSLRGQTPFRMISAELMFRSGELGSDWKWIWLSPSSGRVEYSKSNPDSIKITNIAQESTKDWADPDDLIDLDMDLEPEEPS